MFNFSCEVPWSRATGRMQQSRANDLLYRHDTFFEWILIDKNTIHAQERDQKREKKKKVRKREREKDGERRVIVVDWMGVDKERARWEKES